MIYQPRIGQRVRIHYRKGPPGKGKSPVCDGMPYHGRHGTILCSWRKNCGAIRNVGLDVDGQKVVVPTGNLVAI